MLRSSYTSKLVELFEDYEVNTVPEPAPEDREQVADRKMFARVRRMMLIAGLTTALAVGSIMVAVGYRLFRGGFPRVDASFSSGSALQWGISVILPLLIVLAVLARRLINSPPDRGVG